jgi:integrase
MLCELLRQQANGTIDESKPKANRAPNPANRSRTLDPFAIGAICLLIFTRARLREVLDAKWEYVDFERDLTFLPDSKTGKKAIVLSTVALDVCHRGVQDRWQAPRFTRAGEFSDAILKTRHKLTSASRSIVATIARRCGPTASRLREGIPRPIMIWPR